MWRLGKAAIEILEWMSIPIYRKLCDNNVFFSDIVWTMSIREDRGKIE